MSVPKSVIKFDRNGVKYESSCDKAQYTIKELTRAALRDVGKFLCRETNKQAQQFRGMKKSKRVRGKSSAFQYWARKNECDLQFGCKHGTWYGERQELGTKNQPKKAIMTTTTENNIAEIIKIESQYLSALEDEATALSLISEEEYQGGDDED